jgi:succinyl-diaminopimelate desuccinylase
MSPTLLHDPVQLTRALLRFDTVNPPGREQPCVELLADLLTDAGFACRTHAFAPQRTSLVARLAGSGSAGEGRAPLAFTGHVDVVPLGNAPWQHDPFGAVVVDGKLYGRGASDMKSGVAAFTTAALAAGARWRDEGRRGGPGISLIITAGEETGCEGAFAMAASPQARELLGTAGALVVAEPTANRPVLGHKGAFWLAAKTRGTTAHGSMPERGDNAIYKMARAALALERFEFDSPSHPLMGAPTLNVGTARGGLNINSVPDAAELGIDIRTVAGQDHAHVLRCLCRVLGAGVSLRTLLDVESVFTAADDPWMRRVIALCSGRREPDVGLGALADQRAGEGTLITSFFTDAAALRLPLGMPPVVILGPGEPTMAHQTDEFCHVDRIVEAQALFGALIDDWCGPAPR